MLCFVFRNMPVGLRAGMAAMSQIDRSLDEASATLRGRAPQTLYFVVMPLLRPAIVGALVYGFVRAVTTVSAVVFLDVTGGAGARLGSALLVDGAVHYRDPRLSPSTLAFVVTFTRARAVVAERPAAERDDCLWPDAHLAMG